MAESSPSKRGVSVLLGLGILVLPIFFVWSLLRKGHSTTARFLGFGWLALGLLFLTYLNSFQSERPTRLQPDAASDGTVQADANSTESAWCDVLVRGTPRIVATIVLSIDGTGHAVMTSRFSDGSSLQQELVFENGIYGVRESPSGDSYQIRADGSLDILDNDGLVRSARALSAGEGCQ